MNINLHIDRLILDGVDIPRNQHHLLQTSMQSELTRLFTEGGVRPHLASSGALPHVAPSTIDLSSDGEPVKLGRQIARSVYGEIGK